MHVQKLVSKYGQVKRALNKAIEKKTNISCGYKISKTLKVSRDMAGSLIHKFTNVFHQKPFRALKKGHDIIKGNKMFDQSSWEKP